MKDQSPESGCEAGGLEAQLEELFQRHDEDPRAAREALRAWELPGGPAFARCRRAALAMDAMITVRLGEYEAGLELATSCLDSTAGFEGESRTLTRAANAYAEALMHLARLREAREFLQKEIARADALGGLHEGHITLQGNLAAVHFYMGTPAGALQPLARALELATDFGDHHRRALILSNFGNLYGQLGDHEKSLESHLACAELLREQGAVRDLANCLHNIGVQQNRLGDPEAALRTFVESLALRDESDDPSKVAKTELDRAYSLVHLDRLDEAEQAIEACLTLHRGAGNVRQEARALTSLANLEYERRRYPEAIERFEQSRQLIAELSETGMQANNEIGTIECLLSMGQIDAAIARLEEDAGASAATDDPRSAHICQLWMRALESAGQPERALAFAKRRIEILEGLHASGAQRTVENLQGIHRMELMRQREQDQLRVRTELEALVADRTRQLMAANEELEQRVDELVKAEHVRSQLEAELRQAQKMDAIGRLAGGVAHDFNNLLTVILGRGELLQEEIEPQHPGQESLREIMEAASRAASLTVQLLAFGRKQALRPTRVDLTEVLEELKQLLSRLIGEDIAVRIERPSSGGLGTPPLCVVADRGQLVQVFMNLAINARDAMPAGGTLSFRPTFVQLEPGGKLPAGYYVSVQVRDTGEGIDDELLGQIFEPFFTTKDAGKGTGLGLSTVHGIVHQSGGTITVESHLGAGSCFEVLLPASLEPHERIEISEARPQEIQAGRTVLVVEDDASIRRMIREGLGRRGYRILEAPDGQAAIDLEEPFDLLICDRSLPKRDGKSVVEALRKKQPDLPCLLISGRATPETASETLEGVHFLPKPFTLRGLLKVLDELGS
jgi:signal transduction histidine kinase